MWEGDLIVEGGGFAGTRTGPALHDACASAFLGTDGIYLKVRSNNGASIKLVVKTDPQVPADIEANKSAQAGRFR